MNKDMLFGFNRWQAITVVAAGIFVGGCATEAVSTGVTEVAPETYRVVARGSLGLPAKSRSVALSQADQFCADKGRSMQVVETGKAPLAGPFEVTFKCPLGDDAEGPGAVVTKKAPASVPTLK